WWFYLHNSFINYNITIAARQLFCAYVNNFADVALRGEGDVGTRRAAGSAGCRDGEGAADGCGDSTEKERAAAERDVLHDPILFLVEFSMK
ncbi:hypothetical protein, partial [uncultured Sutterella sp.]|uniref:hypothetical protein n=1 Tax=uncultured Sutterella sp. TaxID=286133 RepID=UPI00280B2B10